MTSNLQLLQQIEESATGSTTPVGELLRRCQVLAARLPLIELATWVRHESDGYPSAEVPEYRVVRGIARGHFAGPFGSGIKNAVLPASNLPEEYRHWATAARIRKPISALQELSTAKSGEAITMPWPGDLIARVQTRFFEEHVLVQAWLSISRADVIAILETVRNRILNFALESEKFVGESSTASTSGVAKELSQVFHTYIIGGVSNISQGASGVSQSIHLNQGDWSGLVLQLERLRVARQDIDGLQAAISHDGDPKDGRLGPQVASWLGRMVSKAFAGSWEVAKETAATLLANLLGRYYGMS